MVWGETTGYTSQFQIPASSLPSPTFLSYTPSPGPLPSFLLCSLPLSILHPRPPLCLPSPGSPCLILRLPFFLTTSVSPPSPLLCPQLPTPGDHALPSITHLAGIRPFLATGTHHVVRDSPGEHSLAGRTGNDGDIEALEQVREWVWRWKIEATGFPKAPHLGATFLYSRKPNLSLYPALFL